MEIIFISCVTGKKRSGRKLSLKETLQRFSKTYRIRIYEFSIGGNHVHMVLQPRSKELLKAFIKAISGRIAQKITGTKKGKPLGQPFFDYFPFHPKEPLRTLAAMPLASRTPPAKGGQPFGLQLR